MRKTVIALVALGLVVASSAFAGNLVNEAFTYANGNLVPNNPGAPATGPWATYSGATGDVQIVSNYATGVMATSAFANDDALPFTAQTALVPTYACFNVYIPCFGSTAPVGAYFAGLKDAGTSNMVARVYVLSQGTTGQWTFGISNTSTNATFGATPWTQTLSCDTWYTIVVKYDPTIGTSTMWVNPVNEASPFVTNTNATNPGLAVSTVFLRQGVVLHVPDPRLSRQHRLELAGGQPRRRHHLRRGLLRGAGAHQQRHLGPAEDPVPVRSVGAGDRATASHEGPAETPGLRASTPPPPDENRTVEGRTGPDFPRPRRSPKWRFGLPHAC